MCLLRGRVYSALENQPRAVHWLRHALKLDVQCIEALDLIVDNRMLTPVAERSLLAELTFPAHLEWLRLVYRAKLDQHDPCSEMTVVATATALEAFGIKYAAIHPYLFLHVVSIGTIHVYHHVQRNSCIINITSVNVTSPRNSTCHHHL